MDRLRTLCFEQELTVHLTNQPEIKRAIDDLVVRGDTIQFADPDYREELGYWIGQGVFGTPWLLAKLEQLAISHVDIGKWRSRHDSEVLMSSPVVGVISSEQNDRLSQVKTGQVFERLWLQAEALDIRLQPMSQIVEVPELRDKLARRLPDAEKVPQQPFRLGYADAESEHTPRRPLETMLKEY